MDGQMVRVVGTSHDGRQQTLARMAAGGCAGVGLEREAENPYDPNAIKVMALIGGRWVQAGFLSREDAAVLAPMADADPSRVSVTAWQVVGGSNGMSYGLRIWIRVD